LSTMNKYRTDKSLTIDLAQYLFLDCSLFIKSE
jgi:hypothetical protein